ncbi:hypothetical protein Tco_0227538 [Tanacetum coccineum]
MHNNIMAAGSKDRPPMLGPGRYSQWRSRFLRYLDTKSNGEYLRKCIFEGPYLPTNVLIAAVEAAENILPVAAHEEAETIHNMTAENRLYFQAEKEAIFLILTGIGDEIYSTVDACNTSKEMWTAIERLQQGESLQVIELRAVMIWPKYANPISTSIATASNTSRPFIDQSSNVSTNHICTRHQKLHYTSSHALQDQRQTRYAPILSLPGGSEDFVVYCDASLKGFGAVLMQRERKANVVVDGCAGRDKERLVFAGEGEEHLEVRSMERMLKRRVMLPFLEDEMPNHVGNLINQNIPLILDRIKCTRFEELLLGSNMKADIADIFDLFYTKSAHFIPMNEKFKMEKLTRLYLKEIVCGRGAVLISWIRPSFASRVLEISSKSHGNDLRLSCYHLETDGQSRKTIQILEGHVTACLRDGLW